MAKMLKNLGNLLIKTAIVSSMAVPLFFAGCKEENYPPVAKLEVNPLYGDTPLEVRIKVDGDDLNGKEDIIEYRADINTELIKSKTPIDITRTFDNPGTIQVYGEVVDSENESDRKKSSVEVYRGPFLEQSASLFNDIEIKYSATLSKIEKAELNVKKNGTLLLTEEIKDAVETGVDYEKTFKYSSDGITKGNYEFVLKSENLEKKAPLIIPNYKPTADFSSLETDLEQDAEINLTLPTPLDKNPEDNLVPIKSAKSLDGKTQLTLNGYDLKIKALPNQTGNYQVEIEYGSESGGLEKTVLNGEITAHTWKYLVNPFVQPNDTTKPIIWDNFTTLNQINTHFDDRIYNYDKSDTIHITEEVCTDKSRRLAINFNGYGGLPEDPLGLYINNWHNIPMYTVTLMKPVSFHSIVAVMMKDYVSDIDAWRFIEPGNDSTRSLSSFDISKVYKIVLNYTFVNKYDGLLDGIPMLEFIPNGNGGWMDSGYRNPEINLIEQRKK
ncbi:MAG: hypothetical protein ABIE36_02255 [Candidatus Diapherotrites archaeon]